ncbi:MAG: type IV secretion pathway protein [Alphaproteobacteria bacterium]|nr:type IV secretion pathway protein [Alphaproteobacteria bacterium]
MCVMAWPLGGCATFSSAPPTCDGLARRPLNRSLWDWEGAPQALGSVSSSSIRTAETGRSNAPSALNSAAPAPSIANDKPNASRLNDLASYRSCGKEG